jgi:hypothetical protein
MGVVSKNNMGERKTERNMLSCIVLAERMTQSE